MLRYLDKLMASVGKILEAQNEFIKSRADLQTLL